MTRNGRNPKSPAFQFYPGDFLSDPKVQAMTTEEVGAYCLLLFQAWIDNGLPNDLVQIARRARLSASKFARVWPIVKHCWIESENGRLVNPRMERERAFQALNRDRLRSMAEKAASARWKKDSVMPDACGPHAEGMPNHARPIPDTRYPIPDTRNPTPSLEEQPANESPGVSKPKPPRKKPTGEHAETIQYWESEWTRTRLGTKCAFSTADGVAVAWMLKQGDAQEARRRMTLMLEDPDPWIAKNASPAMLRSKWNSYAVMVRPAVQPRGADMAEVFRSMKAGA